ncbi:type II secretion system protein N [Hydrogenophaga sp. A37]|uniref:type II secretion system protein N n=1 Tax=Hydrogenophaga sp. A37 TaxID=1945864 RepID=UPI000986A65D|nr:type II secretion system protein N [Hydrogenophaga sp. A37]OOG84916.1 general secretion pathway protein GspN [Hydrogenophaga sp. A37]
MAHPHTVRWAWLGASLGLLIALLLFAPARWLGSALHNATGGRVQLVNTRGTVWNGRGDLLLSGGEGSRGQTALPQGVRWTLAPGWQQGPAVKAQLTSPCCTERPIGISLRPGLSNTDVVFSAFSSRWPAALLVGLGTPWNTLRLDGQLVFQSPGFTVAWHSGRPQLKGLLVIEARDLATRVSTLRPLGSYRVELRAKPEGDQATLALTTLSGGLQLQGNGQWVGGRLRFRGDAQAAPGNETALANLLSIIGRREGVRSLLTFG